MDLLEQFVRRYAKRTTHNGVRMVITDGDPLLADAFAKLGWSDPQPEESQARDQEVAVERRAPEQAVESHPTER